MKQGVNKGFLLNCTCTGVLP